MRTLPYGNSFRDHHTGNKRTSYQTAGRVWEERELEGDDIPVFDRWSSGGRGDYERPDRYEDRVTSRKIKPWRR